MTEKCTTGDIRVRTRDVTLENCLCYASGTVLADDTPVRAENGGDIPDRAVFVCRV